MGLRLTSFAGWLGLNGFGLSLELFGSLMGGRAVGEGVCVRVLGCVYVCEGVRVWCVCVRV